jgi:hypothetical protein
VLTCEVCGQSYGLTHTCAGIAPEPDKASRWIAPEKVSLQYYLRLALGIARLDDAAIRAAARDKHALSYGALIWLGANFFVLGVGVALAARQRPPDNWLVFLISVSFSLSVVVLLLAALALVQWFFAHILARWLFRGRGGYLEIVRAMTLGSFVTVLLAIPIVGVVVGGVWLTAIFMCVFEEVDGIQRMQACGLALAFNILFYGLTFSLLPLRH